MKKRMWLSAILVIGIALLFLGIAVVHEKRPQQIVISLEFATPSMHIRVTQGCIRVWDNENELLVSQEIVQDAGEVALTLLPRPFYVLEIINARCSVNGDEEQCAVDVSGPAAFHIDRNTHQPVWH